MWRTEELYFVRGTNIYCRREAITVQNNVKIEHLKDAINGKFSLSVSITTISVETTNL